VERGAVGLAQFGGAAQDPESRARLGGSRGLAQRPCGAACEPTAPAQRRNQARPPLRSP